jgi:chromosome segregation ATPase
MRDYNAIAFRSPNSTKKSIATSYQQQQQQHHEEEKKEQMSKDSHSTEPTQAERSLSPLPLINNGNHSHSHIPLTTPLSPQPSSQYHHHNKNHTILSSSSSPTRPSGIPPPTSHRSPLPPPPPPQQYQQHHQQQQQEQQYQQQRSPQQQQQQQGSMSNSNNNNSSTASASLNMTNNSSMMNTTSMNVSNASSQQQLSAADALSVRRDGAETTIVKLRHALDDSSQKDASTKTALAKSDAVILELRSSVRQLKRQLDRVQDEKNTALEAKKAALEKLQAIGASQSNNTTSNSTSRSMQDNTNGNTNNNNNNATNDTAIMMQKQAQELQLQLDRAHAQILTADMVRKELEDTLEAEQYTWELRVQDQERQIAELQQDCATLVNDLEAVRQQYKSSQHEKDEMLQELSNKLAATQLELARYKSNSNSGPVVDTSTSSTDQQQVLELQQKLVALEQERAELQACLDEALKELEAVDAELQADPSAALRVENEALQKQLVLLQRNNNNSNEGGDVVVAERILEPLVQLHRLVLQRDGVPAEQIQAALKQHRSSSSSSKNKPAATARDAQQVIAAIQLHLDQVSREQKSRGDITMNSAGGGNEKDLASMRQQVRELQAQISVYKGDLQARDESSAELRTSLKEAVSLLKPLQDAVSKADREKSRLQARIQELQKNQLQKGAAPPTESEQLERKKLRQELMDKDKEIDDLRHQVDHLEVQLTKTKAMAASGLIAAHKTPSPTTAAGSGSSVAGAGDSPTSEVGESKARAKLRAKRAEEQQLKQLLRDAQSRFKSLHQQNAEVESKNIELQGRLNAEQLNSPNASSNDRSIMVPSIEEHQELMQALQEREMALEEVENELKVHKGELAKKAVEMRTLERELEQARLEAAGHGTSSSSARSTSSAGGGNNANVDTPALHEAKSRVQFLERKLNETDKELRHKRETERSLNRSLKEALNLLRPLQMHLEEAEREKRELAMELQDLQNRLDEVANDGGNDHHDDSMDDPAMDGGGGGIKKSSGGSSKMGSKDTVALHVKELEYAVRQLEKENAQLHDALEDMSHSINASHVSGTTNKHQAEAATARLRDEFKELKKSHDVTQSRLEDMFVENHTLVEALKKREKEEVELAEEVNILRRQLERAEAQLQQQPGQQQQQQQSGQSQQQSQSRYKQPPSPGNLLNHRGQR